LWAAQRSHSYATAAFRIFSKMSSSKFSPDGLLGGRGYIQSVKDLRAALANSVELLSSFSDTIHDEISAPHWRNATSDEIEEIVDDVQEIRSNPEQHVEQEYEQEIFENPKPENPIIDTDDSSSSSEDDDEHQFFQTSATKSKLAGGNSSVPVSTLPGPRVDRIGPASGSGYEGSFNPPSDFPSDEISPHSDFSEYPGSGEYDLSNPPNPNPTDGDVTVLKGARKKKAKLDTYSWLPGANNERPLDWYRPGLTDKEMSIMKQMSDPTFDYSKPIRKHKEFNSKLWDKDISGAI
jgi:hypothetical protein